MLMPFFREFCDSQHGPLHGYPGRVHDSTMEQTKANHRDIRKKFRKMKRTFDIAMQQSNQLFIDEHDAIKTAKRIAQENE